MAAAVRRGSGGEFGAAQTMIERFEVVGPSDVPVIFTAPHNIPLQRDGNKDHKLEEHTSFLARDFASSTGAGLLSWSKREIDAAQAFLRENGRPDPSNRDPNYLTLDELPDSPWYATLRALHSRCLEMQLGLAASSKRGQALHPILHIDVHGAADEAGPNPIDLHVGLRAMEYAANPKLPVFRRELRQELAPFMENESFQITVTPSRLTGAWPPDTRRLTVSQQSCRIGYSLSVQLEFSRRLRKALKGDKNLRRTLISAVLRAARNVERSVAAAGGVAGLQGHGRDGSQGPVGATSNSNGNSSSGDGGSGASAGGASASVSGSVGTGGGGGGGGICRDGRRQKLFTFGPNSTAQLRKRLADPELVSIPAVLEGYTRIFCRKCLPLTLADPSLLPRPL